MTLRRVTAGIFSAALIGAAVFWLVTTPKSSPPILIEGLTGDADRGAIIFAAAGCASCHAAPEASGADKLVLSGGLAFASPFGTFYAPNISNHATEGIGGWSALDLVNAMRYGTSPDGQHYYPAFPYSSYTRVAPPDIVDLHAYMQTLPASDQPSRAHEVGFPFNIRRSLGGWKLLFMASGPVIDTPGLPESVLRGRYLVEGLGHCAECHTPRGLLGNLQLSNWLNGAAHPSGKGRIPALRGIDWSEADIAEYLKSGFTPDFDTAGAEMADVVENTSKLSDEDRAAIAAYIKALPQP